MSNKYLVFLFIGLTIYSFTCHKDSLHQTDLPECIQNMINDLNVNSKLLSISTQTVSGEVFYRLNTGALAYDGCDYVINAQCDTVCTLCGFQMPQECWNKYEEKQWKLIWQK
jgi:hypothetical protein